MSITTSLLGTSPNMLGNQQNARVTPSCMLLLFRTSTTHPAFNPLRRGLVLAKKKNAKNAASYELILAKL